MGTKTTYWGHGPNQEVLPDGQSLTIDDRTLIEAQAEAQQRCDHYLAERLSEGFKDILTGKTFQTDDTSLMKLTAVAASALTAQVLQTPETFMIISADNSIIKLSALDTLALLNGRMFPWVSGSVFANRANKDAITVLVTNDACDNYNVSQGYP